jgi:hypothetical protein
VDDGTFVAELPPGRYTVTVERGKEYSPVRAQIDLREDRAGECLFPLRRLFDMSARGWYSADCHVHTPLADLPAAQLADNVNVTFPITAWAIRDDQVPVGDEAHPCPDRGAFVVIDERHGYWNLNTECEIFRVAGEPHVLGAFLILGHTEPFNMTCPPVGPIAEQARRQGAILDWEKPTWPWATMLVPVAGMHTIELSHNSMWRRRTIPSYLWGRTPPEWVGQPPLDVPAFLNYTFESYSMMLNAGFKLVPSAGTANGVHPVPLGHSRVYARIDGAFTYDKWLAAFKQGRSFATNGPMLLLKANDLMPGDTHPLVPDSPLRLHVTVEILSTGRLDRAELIVNGHVVQTLRPAPDSSHGAHRWTFETDLNIEGTSWLAARCFDKSGPVNSRYAHTGAIHFDDPARPLRPDPRQIDYLIHDVRHQLQRHKAKLPPPALTEYEQALHAYQHLAGP